MLWINPFRRSWMQPTNRSLGMEHRSASFPCISKIFSWISIAVLPLLVHFSTWAFWNVIQWKGLTISFPPVICLLSQNISYLVYCARILTWMRFLNVSQRLIHYLRFWITDIETSKSDLLVTKRLSDNYLITGCGHTVSSSPQVETKHVRPRYEAQQSEGDGNKPHEVRRTPWFKATENSTLSALWWKSKTDANHVQFWSSICQLEFSRTRFRTKIDRDFILPWLVKNWWPHFLLHLLIKLYRSKQLCVSWTKRSTSYKYLHYDDEHPRWPFGILPKVKFCR